jgi:hypothetical protein
MHCWQLISNSKEQLEEISKIWNAKMPWCLLESIHSLIKQQYCTVYMSMD